VPCNAGQLVRRLAQITFGNNGNADKRSDRVVFLNGGLIIRLIHLAGAVGGPLGGHAASWLRLSA
jgi:hypothetical protein